MTDRPVLEPTEAHPLTVEATGRHVVVLVGGEVIAETDAALTLREASYPAVQYVPMADVASGRLKSSATTTYCPFKGDASYYDVTTTDGRTVEDAAWAYDAPYPAVAPIAGHLAFYPDKADVRVGS